jgi:hypothetical protein
LGAAALILLAPAAGLLGLSRAYAADSAAALLESMEAAKPDWLPSLDTCPRNVMPARETELKYLAGRCATAPEQCVHNCRAGDANDCYASALVPAEGQEQRGLGSALPSGVRTGHSLRLHQPGGGHGHQG